MQRLICLTLLGAALPMPARDAAPEPNGVSAQGALTTGALLLIKKKALAMKNTLIDPPPPRERSRT
ncbi:MAG: hypothetical protein FWG50_13940 [Kiritimatiellaeota bacterium]|nr:hypothetical protein [Kiritimatiellota bacterium]